MEAPRTNLRRSGRLLWIVLIVAALAPAAYVAWRFAAAMHAPTRGAVAAPAPASAPAPGAGGAPEEAVGPEGARSLLEGVSENALFRRWLAAGDLVRRWAAVTENVAEGESPRRMLGFLAPRAPFSVVRRGDRVAISDAAYGRYDRIADAIDSIDARALATAYRRLHGALDVAYRALGFPAGALDRATVRALQRIEDAPAADGDVWVERRGRTWAFADARLERLPEVEKHLLRMGPRNERLVQAKAREIGEALALPPIASAPR